MFSLLRRFIFDEAFARRAFVVTALTTGGFLSTAAGANATAGLLDSDVRGLLVLVCSLVGGAAAVQGNGSAPKPPA